MSRFTGQVLRGVNTSPTNAPTTAEASTGVVRDVRPVPTSYTLPSPDLVDARADQYRAAILQAPGTTIQEYLVWAQNTSNLTIISDPNDPAWQTEQGTGTFPTGTLTVADSDPTILYDDGTDRVIVTDDGSRSLSQILYLVVARGDVDYDDDGWTDSNDPSLGRKGDNPYLVFTVPLTNQNPVSGVVRLSPSQLTALGGGLSAKRGDSIVTVRYTVAPSRFWWTRNDRYETRFGWNGKTQKWEPYKGSSPKDLGSLLLGSSYTLDPKVTNLPVGAFLPGNETTPDAYAMIRLGGDPGVTSIPVGPGGSFVGVQVKPDKDVDDFDFSTSPTLSGVMGQTNGKIRFNPDFAKNHLGKHVWYVPKTFSSSADGVVGKLLDAASTPIFIAPIPGPLDCPLIRLGNRRYLTASTFLTDADMDSAPVPAEGEVLVSLSTGRIRLSPADIYKADPTRPEFSKFYLGEDVIYDGTALNAIPQPTQRPVRLVDADGNPATGASAECYIPDSAPLPDEFTDLLDEYRGLGVSGVIDAPDGTGAIPNNPGIPASVRPGGDNETDTNTGRIRQVVTDVGDTILFSSKSAIARIHVVDRESDLPSQADRGEAWIARERGTQGSRVIFNNRDLSEIGTGGLFFLQSTFIPAYHTRKARIYSRGRDIFRFAGDEVLYFAVDGAAYTWSASSIILALPNKAFFTPEEVAASIASVITGTGTAYAFNGRVVIEAGDPDTGSVEIGFGNPKDLSGAAALGFLPGWRAKGGVTNWLPDAGLGVGLYRSPVNMDRTKGTADMGDSSRVTNGIVQNEIQPAPFVFLTNPPLQDVAGYDEGVFFSLTTQVDDGSGNTQMVIKPLQNYVDLIYRFGQGKFDWVESGTCEFEYQQPVSAIQFSNTNIVPESLLGVPGIGGGLFVSPDGEASEFQTLGTDYLLPQGGMPGTAILTETFGSRVLFGAMGQVVEAGGTTFADSTVDFTQVQPGYRLKITSGRSIGSYLVTSVISSSTIAVDPPIRTVDPLPVTWEIYSGYSEDVYDPALVADMFFNPFSHLPEEPFKVRMLSPVGPVPTVAGVHPVANLAGALDSGRAISLRYGLVAANATNTASLVGLTSTFLGIIANGSLAVPTDEPRFSTGSFVIQIGGTRFTPVGVTSFSNPVPSGTVEYLTVDTTEFPKGSLKFATDLLTRYAMARVTYFETFLPAADLPELTVEYDGSTGALNFSQADMNTWGGTKAYLVEQMVTEDRKDVSLNPQLGTFAFISPVPKGSTVEAEYYLADLEGRRVGNPITEFLPVFVRNEVAVRVDDYTYTFNHNGLTVDPLSPPIIYTGAIMMNFGTTDCVVSYPPSLNGAGQIKFLTQAVSDDTVVKITYAVYEAQGGERAFETSQKPVYRPPFYIKANQTRFGLRGNRASEFVPGQMLRFGDECFYVKGTTYYPTSVNGPVTGVEIFPGTINEVGSRAPANDVLSLVTARPITTVVDPDGPSPISTTAPAGFMQPLDLAVFPFEPVSRGQSTITFRGDLSRFAVAGHIFEIGGYPHTIASSDVSDDGTRTRITVTAPFRTGFSMDSPPTVKMSCRPVYPPQTRDFVGVGPMVPTEPHELVLFGRTDDQGVLPGQSLVEGVDYTIDSTTGAIQLLEPVQEAMGGSQKLLLSFTRLRTLQPVVRDGVVVSPRANGSYLYTTVPSTKNGLLGGLLTGTYTFRNPDTFYFRVVPMATFLSEAATEAIQEITAQQASGGAPKPAPATKNWQQGRIGLKTERKNLVDKDRAARTFLDFYSTTVNTFEQIEETISGGCIGDRDGKFRFWVGRGKDYPTPGYEDEITGVLTSRFVWGDAFNGQRATPSDPNYITVLPDDWIVSPDSFSLSGGSVAGDIPDPDLMKSLLNEQRTMVLNDVDDLVAVRLSRPRVFFTGSFPFFHLKAKAQVARMADQHRLSRIFPTVTRAFFMTFPGLGADPTTGDFGVYTWGRYFDGGWKSTHGNIIGQLYNPVLDDIDNVRKARLSRRRSRARVWGYFPYGIPAGAFDNGTSPAILDPCIVASPAMIRDIQVDPATGFPVQSQFISQGGGTPDLEAGDPEMALLGFQEGDEIEWGKPDGTTRRALCPVGVDIGGQPSYTGIFVREVLYGCVLTFKDGNGDDIVSPFSILVGTGADSGVPAHLPPYAIVQGDTIYVGSDLGITKAIDRTPEAAAQYIDTYRPGFDVDVNSDGTVEDNSYPSFHDPTFIPIKEIIGQNTPDPLTPLEGPVSFVFEGENPLEIPALKGELTDDSGDFQIPYINMTNTELDRFGQVFTGLTNLFDWDFRPLPDRRAVYPDEILSPDCEVSHLPNLSALHLPKDVTPPPAPGVGPVSNYDLVLVQVENPGPFTAGPASNPTISPQGIFSVGKITEIGGEGYIEVPRFVTQTTPPGHIPGSSDTGSAIGYVLEGAQAFIDTSPGYPYSGDPQGAVPTPPGVELIEIESEGATYLKFSSIGQISLNDGFAPGAGNFNEIWAAHPSNIVRVKVVSRWDSTVVAGPGFPLPTVSPGGVVCLTIEIQQGQVTVRDYTGASWTVPLGSPPQSGVACPLDPMPDPALRYIKIPATGVIPWGPLGPALPNQWYLPYAVSGATPNRIWQTIYGFEFKTDVETAAGASTTGWISDDRLTFNEVYDLRLAKARGTEHPQSSLNMEASLVVLWVMVGNTAGTAIQSTVNWWSNGWAGFTFPGTPGGPAGGTWTPRSNPGTPERASLKVCGYEGWDNTEIFGNGITASLLPSDEAFESNYILSGTGFTASKYSGIAEAEGRDDRISDITVTSGAISNVVPGDILVIEKSANPTHIATTMAGTYLVRHTVEPTVGTAYRQVSLSTSAGSATGWCPIRFPKVISYDDVTHTLILTDFAPVEAGSPVGPYYSGFPSAGRLYVMINPSDLASSDENTFKAAVVSCAFTAISTDADLHGIFTIDPAAGQFHDASGGSLAGGEAAFKAAIRSGMDVSGMVYWPLAIGGEQGLPDNNCVGYHSDALNPLPPPSDRAVYGLRWVSIAPPLALSTATPAVFSGDLADPLKIDTVPAPDTLAPLVSAPNTANVFLPQTARVYHWVAHTLDTTGIGHSTWASINIPPGSWGVVANEVDCLLPSSTLSLANGSLGGFYAQGGVFLEPSFPRMATNLVTGYPGYRHIVDASNSLPDPSLDPDIFREIGMRDTEAYVVGPPVGIPEEVTFKVKRIRRFHQASLLQNLKPLWYAYEIRRGIVTNYTPDPVRQTAVVEASGFYMNWIAPPGAPKPADVWEDGSGPHTGTNLGTFTDANVNIHAGDMFRLLHDDGTLLEEVPIAAVLDDGSLMLAPPGITKILAAEVPNHRFEIYLRRPPVPHEQSNEQLLELITDREVFRTDADWTTEKGGYVQDTGTDTYANVVNKLCDDLQVQSFSALGVRKGDIVIVDPAGKIPRVGALPVIQEKGGRPLGDLGVPQRTPGVYIPGRPTPTDDNRGFYRVLRVNDSASPAYIEVSPVNSYAGTEAIPVVFAPNNDQRAYAVYPTVSDSPVSTSGSESQMALRPTAFRDAVTKTFDGRPGEYRFHSIRPFSYRVIRPSKIFTDETIDLVLMHRERILSLIEMLRRLLAGDKAGTYFVFQRDEHCDELGDPRDPDIGLGVISNAYLMAVIGRTDVVPFSNNEYCLSLLDRRFWIYDRRLDSLTTDPTNPFNMKVLGPGETAYTAYTASPDGIDVNPVLPERVEEVLRTRDRFRELRYVWLAYRTHKTLGTMAAIRRYDAEIAKRLVDQLRALLKVESLKKVQS